GSGKVVPSHAIIYFTEASHAQAPLDIKALWAVKGIAECRLPMPQHLASPAKLKKLDPRVALAHWMESTDLELSRCRKLIEDMQTNFNGVLAYFGEDPELTPQEFFTTLHTFIKAFDEAKIYVERQAKKKEQERRLAEKKALADARKRKVAEERRRREEASKVETKAKMEAEAQAAAGEGNVNRDGDSGGERGERGEEGKKQEEVRGDGGAPNGPKEKEKESKDEAAEGALDGEEGKGMEEESNGEGVGEGERN
ncbi:unnamed protein product, partial [Discosporangium mesarthrocarpum]